MCDVVSERERPVDDLRPWELDGADGLVAVVLGGRVVAVNHLEAGHRVNHLEGQPEVLGLALGVRWE